MVRHRRLLACTTEKPSMKRKKSHPAPRLPRIKLHKAAANNRSLTADISTSYCRCSYESRTLIADWLEPRPQLSELKENERSVTRE
ncbi:hypothetical protein E2C01_011548 [Portunus trituberculatus]|uniref:Uncharacterized protein n=1 Tax=Portunus trituberculatus TaxID=210409 RepID=A0A5B7DC40_PORTR|nr:hypothetical protein [Portunus trituberculatus]